MGGGDLNLKKSWHPSTYANLKKLWEAQQAHQKEEQKLEQLRKEKVAERENEEMKRLQESAGLKVAQPERVEWLYSGSSTATTSLSEEYLLGKRHHEVDSNVRTTPTEADEANLSSVNVLSKPRDFESKIREDPLFVMKQTEHNHHLSTKSNETYSKIYHERIRLMSSHSRSKDNKSRHGSRRSRSPPPRPRN